MENEQTYFTSICVIGLATPEEPQLNAAQLEAVTTTEGFASAHRGLANGKRARSRIGSRTWSTTWAFCQAIFCASRSAQGMVNEMRQRIRRVTGDNDTGYICTFHSFCVSVLQEDSLPWGTRKSFLVLDNAGMIDAMLQVIYDERKITLREKTFSKALDMIEILKTIERPDYYLDLISLPLAELKQKYLDARKVDDIIFRYLYQQKMLRARLQRPHHYHAAYFRPFPRYRAEVATAS